jgi:hypothetical protein
VQRELFMFSRILIKLIDQAILPAVALLTTRVVSIILLSKYLGFDIAITSGGFTFSSTKEYLYINSYSTLFMGVILAIGLGYILIKSYAFHDTHVAPGTAARLFSYNLATLIQNSYDLYTQGAIWLSYMFLITLLSGMMALYTLVFVWVFFAMLALTVLFTVLFILDVENEVIPQEEILEDIELEE